MEGLILQKLIISLASTGATVCASVAEQVPHFLGRMLDF